MMKLDQPSFLSGNIIEISLPLISLCIYEIFYIVTISLGPKEVVFLELLGVDVGVMVERDLFALE